MLFNSIDFLIFFPIVVFIYFIIPKRLRYVWLLISSYYFYMSWNPKYAILIALSTVITYTASLLLNMTGNPKLRKSFLIFSIVSNLGILAVFKYFNFFLTNLDQLLSKAGLDISIRPLDLLLPVGISFYTFQALSYTIDTYRRKISPEKNFLRYALYVSFFPQLVAGPIERSENLLPQVRNIEKIHLWNYERISQGFMLMMWGFFQKLVIADRASILVKSVYENYAQYGITEILIATICFAFQIYGDFGGYTNIARGAAKIMGIDLMQNFKQPYFASSIKDFWRRWHISLTSWFTDYLYIPLGGNRKGTLRKHLNILIVFAISGLWHGASWNFVAWGLLHAFYQIVEDIIFTFKKPKKDMPLAIRFLKKVCLTLTTFILVCFAWIFFAADSFLHACSIIHQMFTNIYFTRNLPGFDRYNIVILAAAILLLAIVDLLHEKKISLFSLADKLFFPVRWIVYVLFIWIVIMFGVYGVEYDTGTFIYFQF